MQDRGVDYTPRVCMTCLNDPGTAIAQLWTQSDATEVRLGIVLA